MSLSCGPSFVENAEHLKQHSTMWRLTGDLWDQWEDIHNMFEKCEAWAPHSGDGHWPDCDMLPLGHISIIGSEHNLGERYCRLTRDEQRTMITLWCIFRSPLMFGGECTDLDEFTLSLLTNPDILRMSSCGRNQHRLILKGLDLPLIA